MLRRIDDEVADLAAEALQVTVCVVKGRRTPQQNHVRPFDQYRSNIGTGLNQYHGGSGGPLRIVANVPGRR